MTIITDEMKQHALADMEVAPDIVFSAEIALIARGVDDAQRVVPALLAAAWFHHKEAHGANCLAPFVEHLRGWADRIEAMERPH